MVLVGVHDLENIDKDINVFKIAKQVKHHKLKCLPFGKNTVHIYDFMMITLKKPVTAGPTVVLANLPTSDMGEDFLIGKTLTVSGWGSRTPVTYEQFILKDDIDVDFPDSLRKLEVRYILNSECEAYYRSDLEEHKVPIDFTVNTDLLCTVGTMGKISGTCVGDSGGK